MHTDTAIIMEIAKLMCSFIDINLRGTPDKHPNTHLAQVRLWFRQQLDQDQSLGRMWLPPVKLRNNHRGMLFVHLDNRDSKVGSETEAKDPVDQLGHCQGA